MAEFQVGDWVEVSGKYLAIYPRVGVVTEVSSHSWGCFASVRMTRGVVERHSTNKLKKFGWRKL